MYHNNLKQNTSFEKWKQNEAPSRSMRVRLKPTRLWAKFQEIWALHKLFNLKTNCSCQKSFTGFVEENSIFKIR
jgi:hypothetical protein